MSANLEGARGSRKLLDVYAPPFSRAFSKLEKCASESNVSAGLGDKVRLLEHKRSYSRSPLHNSSSQDSNHVHRTPPPSPFSFTMEQIEDSSLILNDLEDASMMLATEQSPRSSGHTNGHFRGLQQNGSSDNDECCLITPKKLANPCLDSLDHQNLRKEILWNNKMGNNVLHKKTELQKTQEKFQEARLKRQLEEQKAESKTSFEKVLEQRAKKIEEDLHNMSSEEKSPSKESQVEFLQIHAKLRSKMAAASQAAK